MIREYGEQRKAEGSRKKKRIERRWRLKEKIKRKA